MKLNFIIIGILTVVLLIAAGCAGTSKSASQTVTVSIDDLNTQKYITRDIKVAAGDTVKVVLGSNPSTGFSWTEQANIADTSIIRQDKHETVAAANSDKVVGAAGTEEWTFTAVKTGTTTVSMDYSRPWEGGEKGVWTFKLNVMVK
jgi:inhibitor of cysteine peptidase